MVTMFMNGITISVAPVDVAFYKQAGYVIVPQKVEHEVDHEPHEIHEQVQVVEASKKVSKK
jgi:hypothetical protein